MDTPGQQVPFRIDLTATPAVVEVDGVDVTDRIAGATVSMGYGAPTTITVTGSRPGSLEGVGFLVADPDGPSVLGFLDSIDPDELEQAVMNGPMDFETMAANYLAELIKRAGAQT